MMDSMFEIPKSKIKKFNVTADYVNEKLSKLRPDMLNKE